MQIDANMTDGAVLGELGARVVRHRLERNLSQEHLANEAGISRRTLQRLEAGETVQLTSFVRVLRTLGLVDGLGALVPPPAPSPMDLLNRAGRQRQRAGSPRGPDAPDGQPWTWGDDGEGDA